MPQVADVLSTHKENDASASKSISSCVEDRLKAYFKDLEGQHPCEDLYQTVLTQVERPLLETVLEFTKGNRVKAAEILGISRNTLMKKMKVYGL